MHVPQIIEVKERLEKLKNAGMLTAWELPYENLLTRRSAAIFFLTPAREDDATLHQIWAELGEYEHFSQRLNEEKKLSQLRYRITFNPEAEAGHKQQAYETQPLER